MKLETGEKVFFCDKNLFFWHIFHEFIHLVCNFFRLRIFIWKNYFIKYFVFKLFSYLILSYIYWFYFTLIKFGHDYNNSFFTFITALYWSDCIIKGIKHQFSPAIKCYHNKYCIYRLTSKRFFQKNRMLSSFLFGSSARSVYQSETIVTVCWISNE